MNKYSWIWVLITFAVLSGAFQFYSPKVFDPDAFYHITHAKIYRAEGLFFNDFPWVQFSVIKDLKADIWYGFHLLLIPLTFFNDLVFGIKFGAFLLTTAVLFLFYILLKKLGLRWPFFWALLFFFFIPDTNFRFLVLRPHLITFVLGLAVFYFTLKRNNLGLLTASAGLVFIHLALGWIPALIVLITLISARAVSDKINLRPLLAVLGGIAVGAVARPNFLGALKVAYVQIIDLMLAKFNHIPLRLGSELRPVSNLSLVTHEILPLFLLVSPAILILALAIKNRIFKNISPRDQTAIIAALSISLVFGLATIFVARRAMDLWVGFSFIFAGLVFKLLASKYPGYIRRHGRAVVLGGVILILTMLTNTLYYSLFKYPRQSPDHRNFKPAAEWLKDNSKEGDIVFHPYWDNFPILFFYNQKNYYLNGMDPIFLHAFDPGLNIKLYFFSIDKLLFVQGEVFTCGANPCVPGTVVSAYDAIKNDFRASYVFVEPQRNPRFYNYLKNDKRFKENFASPAASVFEVL
ncbi:MAG: hypothetical protein HYV54_01285 [Parcubacteria group bacterium]|nr:hypothetical protein [Parcubacteria group bacterium]